MKGFASSSPAIFIFSYILAFCSIFTNEVVVVEAWQSSSSLSLPPRAFDSSSSVFESSSSRRNHILKQNNRCPSSRSSSCLYDSAKTTESSASASTSSSTVAAADRFHQDMERVLESRMEFAKANDEEDTTNNAASAASPLERRNRPILMDADTDGAERVFSMLSHMVNLGVANEETYQIVMKAFVQRGRKRWSKRYSNGTQVVICAADELGTLFAQLEAEREEKNLNVPISTDTYNLVLEGYAKCSTPRGGRNYAGRAEELLQRMEQQQQQNENENKVVDVNIHSLVHVLHAYAWQQANLDQEGDCAQRATEYLSRIEKLTTDPALLLKCYGYVLEAWSKSGSAGSGTNANSIFMRAKTLHEKNAPVDNNKEVELFPIDFYSNIILAWSKSNEKGSAERAHALLTEMLDLYKAGQFSSEPEFIVFNTVISAYTRIGRTDKAEKILKLMNKVRPHCTNLVPDQMTYNTILHAYLTMRDKEKALLKVISMVEFMEQNCRKQPSIKPNSFTYNTLMKAWIQSRRSNIAEQSERILQKMEVLSERGDESLKLETRHFNMVINAYAKGSHPHGAEMGKSLLNRMKDGSSQTRPDIISYTSVMECYAKSADPAASQIVVQLLDEAFDVYEATGDTAVRPNSRTFSMAIMTLSNNYGSIDRARELLDRLIEMYNTHDQDVSLRPNEYPYNYVLNCAANTMEDKIEAFRIATKTFREMRDSTYLHPDSYTYAFWFKCCHNLLKPRSELKIKCIIYAFSQCRDEGLVTPMILKRLIQGNPEDIRSCFDGYVESTDGFRDITIQKLPPSWTRNA